MEEYYENDYELLYLIRQKDEMAFAALMHKYEEIADKLIKKYIGACKSGLSEDDYLQLARLKLVQTIDDYREDQEASFYHYFCSVFHNLLEKRIVDLRALGYTYRQIADTLQVKVKKVDNTLQKVRKDREREEMR